MVQNLIDRITGQKIDLDLYLYLLTTANAEICSSLQYLIIQIVIAARLLFVQLWKLPQIPSEEA